MGSNGFVRAQGTLETPVSSKAALMYIGAATASGGESGESEQEGLLAAAPYAPVLRLPDEDPRSLIA